MNMLKDVKKISSNIFKKLHKEGKFKYDKFKGKKHKKSTKIEIGRINSKHQKGTGNSQFGTMWITNGKESKKIKKDSQIPKDWYKGRKMIF